MKKTYKHCHSVILKNKAWNERMRFGFFMLIKIHSGFICAEYNKYYCDIFMTRHFISYSDYNYFIIVDNKQYVY